MEETDRQAETMHKWVGTLPSHETHHKVSSKQFT